VYRREGEPYNVVVADLEEGFRMMGRVEGVPAERVEIGARVMTLSLCSCQGTRTGEPAGQSGRRGR
jgi:uncharacterized OB-fold protein